MLVVSVISVDSYPFLAFLDLTYHLEDIEQLFSGFTVPYDINDTKLGSNNQESSKSSNLDDSGISLLVFSSELM